MAATRGRSVARDDELGNGEASANDDDPNELTYLEEDVNLSGSFGSKRVYTCMLATRKTFTERRGGSVAMRNGKYFRDWHRVE